MVLKKKKFWKISLIVSWVVISLVLIVFIANNLLTHSSKDILPIDDSDLKLKIITVSDTDNAYFDLIKIKGIIYESEEKASGISDIASGKIWDEEVAKEIITRNAQAFKYFAEAAQKPVFQDPASANPANITPDTVSPSLSSWRKMAHLSAIKAFYLAKQGNDKEALDEALIPVRIGQKIQESQVDLVEYLVAMSMKGIGLEAAQRIVSSSTLSGDELRPYIRELNQFYDNEDGLVSAFKVEYKMLSVGVDWTAGLRGEEVSALAGIFESEGIVDSNVAEKLIKDSYYFQPNATKALFAGYTRKQIEMVVGPCRNVTDIDIPKLAPLGSPKEIYKTENAVGKILHDVVATSLTTFIVKKCEEDLLVAATQAIFATKAFYEDTGTYPTSLGDLVPKYLSVAVKDPFDNSMLEYSKEKKIFYSVGKDMKKEGGSIGSDWRRMPDPTFKISF